MRMMLVDEPRDIGRVAWFVKEKFAEAEFSFPILYDADYALLQCYNGMWQLWLAGDGDVPDMIMLTSVEQYPAGRQCWIQMILGQNIHALTGKNDTFESWCKIQDITLITALGNSTIAKFAQRYGWKPGTALIYKDLREMN